MNADLKNENTGVGKRRLSLGSLITGSVIISFLMKIAGIIYSRLADGFFGRIFTAYDRENEAVKSSAAAGLLTGRCRTAEERAAKQAKPIKHRIAEGFENSVILGRIRGWLRGMLACQIKVYGLFLFSFALYTMIIYVAKLFLFKNAEVDIGVIVTLTLTVIASVAMISSRHTLAGALIGSGAASFFLFKVVGLRRGTFEKAGEAEGRYNVAFIAGLIFGIASYFVSPVMILVGLGGIIAAYLVLISPEFGVLMMIVLIPVAPTMGLVAGVLYTAFCYLLKLVCGKRSLKFDLLDGTVFIFMLLMIGGGVVAVSGGSLKPMMVYVAFMVGYFLVVNLIRSREWLTRCFCGAIAACTFTALYGLYQNFFGTVEKTWQDSEMFDEISGRVVSTFENPNVLAEYLIMVLPVILAAFFIVKSAGGKFLLAVSFAATAGCLVYTWSRGAWLGIMIGMLIFLLMYSKNTLTVLLFGAFGIPFLPFVLPDSIIQRFTSIGNVGDSSTSYRVYIWDGVLKMLKDYFPTGIGIGTASFSKVYPYYALSGIETAPHSHNLYLQITTEIGIVGLIVFVAAMFFFAQGAFTLNLNEQRKAKHMSSAVFCGILAVLAQGMTDYIWYNYRVFFMFWLMLGLGAAVRRVLESTAQEMYY